MPAVENATPVHEAKYNQQQHMHLLVPLPGPQLVPNLAGNGSLLGFPSPARTHYACDVSRGFGGQLRTIPFEHSALINIDRNCFLPGDLDGKDLPSHDSEAVYVARVGSALGVEHLFTPRSVRGGVDSCGRMKKTAVGNILYCLLVAGCTT